MYSEKFKREKTAMQIEKIINITKQVIYANNIEFKYHFHSIYYPFSSLNRKMNSIQ